MANYKIVSHAGAGLPLNVAIMYNKLRKLENA